MSEGGKLIRGPWKKRPDTIDPATVRWRRGRPIEPTRVYCLGCNRPFNPRGWIPADRTCADCRAEAAAAADAAKPPTLFEADDMT